MLLAVDPARGTPTSDLIPAVVVAVLLSIAIGVLTLGHRPGGAPVPRRIGAFAGRVGGPPPWAGIPAAVVGASLVTAAFGFYWDVATHIDNGRDPGPFANPA